MIRNLTFEEIALRILPSQNRGHYSVQVMKSFYGSGASHEVDLTSLLGNDEQPDGSLASTLCRKGAASLQCIGATLFQSLFSDSVLRVFLQCLGRAENRPNTGLRIRLHLDPGLPEVNALPWELLYRQETGDFLGRNPLTPLVRYLEVERSTSPAPVESFLRILVVLSNPIDQDDPLDLDSERDRLEAAWDGQKKTFIEFLEHPTLLSVRRVLSSERFHVLHFMGHGRLDGETGEGVLVFEDGEGQSEPVRGKVLADALKDVRSLRLVFLNACDTGKLPRGPHQDPFSGVASSMILAGLPAVVAMREPISNGAALVFSQVFYSGLAEGLPVDAAAADGRLACHLAFPDSWEWPIPTLFMSVPDGRILKLPRERTGPRPSFTLVDLAELRPEKKEELLLSCERQLQEFPGKTDRLFEIGMLLLDLQAYSRAFASLTRALESGCREPGLNFYLALASLGGEQPRNLSLSRIKAAEAFIEAAIRDDGESPEVLTLSAIIKYDFYRSKGFRAQPPPIEDLLAAARRCPSSTGDVSVLHRYLTVPPVMRELLLTESEAMSNLRG